MMKKSRIFLFAALLLVLALVLTAAILSNRKTAKTPEDMIPLLRQELGLTKEDAALSFAGEYTAEENVLLWFSMRGDYSVSYWAAECQLLKSGGYRLIKVSRPMVYARDIVHIIWQAEDAFLINDPNCRTIVYSNGAGTVLSKTELSPDDLPYVFLLKYPFGASKCDFLDADGNCIM